MSHAGLQQTHGLRCSTNSSRYAIIRTQTLHESSCFYRDTLGSVVSTTGRIRRWPNLSCARQPQQRSSTCRFVPRASAQPLATGSIVRTSTTEIRWGSFVSRLPVLELAAKEAVSSIISSIGADSQPELAIVFVTSSMGAEFDQVVPILRELLPSLKNIVGCSGYGVIGGGSDGPSEVEGEPAFSLSLGQLPGVDVHVLQTLRSSIPEPGASMREWSDFVGVDFDTPKEVSFMILADPRFTQVKQMVEGLDHAFPESVKIGGVLSTGTRPRARALFAWSAASSEQTRTGKKSSENRGSGGAAREHRRRRRPEKPKEVVVLRSGRGSGDDDSEEPTAAASPAVSDKPSAPAPAAASIAPQGADASNAGGFFGSLVRMLTGSMPGQTAGSANGTSTAASSSSSQGEADVQRKAGGSSRSGKGRSSAEAEDVGSNGMYLHGAVCLVLHGDVKLDTITSMGYRSPSNRLFRVESINRPNEIVTIIPEMEDTATPGSSSGPRVQLVVSGNGDDSSDDDDDPEVQAVVAIVDMLESLGEAFEGNVDELLDTAMLAVARDSGKSSEELTADDFEMVHLEGIAEEYGMLLAGDRLRKGDRFKIMVRDDAAMKEDLRERILAYKRKDLQAMVMGGELPPTFGVVMFTDMDRGTALYEEDNYEARMLSTYLPTPISGLFAGGQIARFNESHQLMENVCVAGILRAVEPSKVSAPVAATGSYENDGAEPGESQEEEDEGEEEEEGAAEGAQEGGKAGSADKRI